MLRTILIIGALAIALPQPVLAITAKDKMATCKFGADDQKLKGAKRSSFISRCMAEEKPASAATTQSKSKMSKSAKSKQPQPSPQ
jgi:hypothetical protein